MYLFGALSVMISYSVSAQELEPRALTNIPVGMNFAAVGYGFTNGNILFDPSLPLEDTKANLHTMVGAYVRAINFFGMSGKIDVVAPYGIGNWTGIYTGIDTSTSRNGFADMRFRLSFNFIGAPALKAENFKDYKPDLISGFSIQIFAPLGQYDPKRLINLGNNRWIFKPQWGISKYFTKWILETYLSAWFFTNNNNFFGGNEVQQKPLYTIKIHGIRRFNNRSWLALDVGYGIGGRSAVNDVIRDTRISTIRMGITYALPISLSSTLKFSAISAIRLEKGADFDSFAIAYQYRWKRKSHH